jgi:hypothetical protein
MTTPTILVSTWGQGLFRVATDGVHSERTPEPVRYLTTDGHGGTLAILGSGSLARRTPAGEWHNLASSDLALSCCQAVGDAIYAGTDDAQLLRLGPTGTLEPLIGFAATAGRDSWYAGTALINGRLLGPPLGIRSLTATCDDGVLLANVHVGGIPRSTDGGKTWQPTISIDADVHEVRAHPTRPEVVIAAAAAGLCISRDAGLTWQIESQGLHATYCSAVAFAGDDILVAAATDHFAAQGGLYRRSLTDRAGLLMHVDGTLPRWLEGIADTHCLATDAGITAVIDRAGNLYLREYPHDWTHRATGLTSPSCLLICR